MLEGGLERLPSDEVVRAQASWAGLCGERAEGSESGDARGSRDVLDLTFRECVVGGKQRATRGYRIEF